MGGAYGSGEPARGRPFRPLRRRPSQSTPTEADEGSARTTESATHTRNRTKVETHARHARLVDMAGGVCPGGWVLPCRACCSSASAAAFHATNRVAAGMCTHHDTTPTRGRHAHARTGSVSYQEESPEWARRPRRVRSWPVPVWCGRACCGHPRPSRTCPRWNTHGLSGITLLDSRISYPGSQPS